MKVVDEFGLFSERTLRFRWLKIDKPDHQGLVLQQCFVVEDVRSGKPFQFYEQWRDVPIVEQEPKP